MSNAFLTKGVRRSLGQIRYVKPVMPGAADGLVAQVYAQAERDFGVVAPPLVLHSPAPAVLAAAWVLLRETLLATGSVSRAEKEIVAASVSAGNACPYCVAVHSASARSLIPGLTPAEIASGSLEPVTDPGLRELATWARGSGEPGPGLPVIGRNFAEIAGVAVAFQYLNRMVTLFLPESPLPPLTPKAVGGWVMDMLGSAMTSPSPAPGASLDLLPEAPLPAGFSWAASEPGVAAALARAAGTIENAGKQAVSAPVRELVLDTLSGWNGRPPGPSRAWAGTMAAGLADADRSAGRLALLTALTPYQVSRDDVADLRRSAGTGAGADEALIGLTAWASMAAARKVGSWLRQRGRSDPVPSF
ncbi:MAG TPA: carboxymuconolactone decarboxylase family protein [Streptosporangiaceae bacterium]